MEVSGSSDVDNPISKAEIEILRRYDFLIIKLVILNMRCMPRVVFVEQYDAPLD